MDEPPQGGLERAVSPRTARGINRKFQFESFIRAAPTGFAMPLLDNDGDFVRDATWTLEYNGCDGY